MLTVVGSEPTDTQVTQETQQAWADLLAAAGQAGYAVSELVHPPATAQQVAAAEEAIGRPLPADLALLYQLADGQDQASGHQLVDVLGGLTGGDGRITRVVQRRGYSPG
jgi:cell wall assembly regulator SMI1